MVYLKNILTRINKAMYVDGSFFKHILYLSTGNGIAILITFITTPILARLYSPTFYGQLALYISLVQSIGALSTLQFTRTFVLPKEDSEFKGLFALAFFILVIVSGVVALTAVVLHYALRAESQSSVSRVWLLILPVSVFLFGAHDMIRGYNERYKNFKRLASGKILSSIISKFTSLSYAIVIQPAFWGLFISEFLVRPVEIFVQLPRNVKCKLTSLRECITRKNLTTIFRKYKTTPMYYLPAIWVINFSAQVPVYLLTLLYSSSAVGHFGMANSLLNIPLNLLVSSIAPVFTQRIAEESKRNLGEAKRLSVMMVKRVLALSLVPNLIALFFAKQIFGYFLGKQWIEAGEFASFMTLYYVVLGLNSVYGLYLVFRKESLYLTINIINLSVGAASIYVGFLLFHDVRYSILFYSIAMLAGNLLHLFFCFKLLGLSALNLFKVPLLIIFGMLILLLFKVNFGV